MEDTDESYTLFETNKCKVDVDSSGEVEITCDKDASLVLSNQNIKMIDGLHELAKRSSDTN